MRNLAWLTLVALAACGGKLGDGSDAGDGGPLTDAIAKKDVKTFDVAPEPDAAPPSGGLNVSGEGPGWESEDQIAVAPDGTIAILWSAFTSEAPYVTMQYAFSTDDGKTFSTPAPVQVDSGLFPGDPAITADAQGNFWASYLGIDYQGQQVAYSRVFVAESPKGTMKFGAPVEISAPTTTDLNDHPKIFVTKAGTLLVGWATYPNGGNATSGTGVVARSTDGTTWTLDDLIAPPDAIFGTFFWFCEGASKVYTTFLEAKDSQYFAGMRASADDGVTFDATTTMVSGPSEQIASLDPACAAIGPDLWVMYGTTQQPSVDESTLDGADHVFIVHSSTEGATFDPPHTDVIDHQKTKLATIPLISLDATGKVDTAYVAGDTAGDMNGSIRFTRIDTLTPIPKVSPSIFVDGPMEFDLSRTDDAWLGDYFGGVAHGGSFYLAYPRNETGLDHIYFAKMPLP